MGTGTILGIYVAIGLFFAIGASAWGDRERVSITLFWTIILLWAYLVPHAIIKIIKGK